VNSLNLLKKQIQKAKKKNLIKQSKKPATVQDNPCSKHTQPLEQTALPLQVQIRSCKKSDDICP
jgi:hypothetical protein